MSLPEVPSHNPQDLANAAKELNLKTKACANFADAFEQAKSIVDERDGLVVVTGSNKLVSEYWKNRGLKKF